MSIARVQQPSATPANGWVTPFTRPDADREPIVHPSFKDRLGGFGDGFVRHSVDYAIAGAVVAVLGGEAIGQLGGLIGAGAVAALSLISAVRGARNPTRQVETRPISMTVATYEPRQLAPTAMPVGRVRSWIRSHAPDASAMVRNDFVRLGAVMCVSTPIAMQGLHVMEWPENWGLAALPGLVSFLIAMNVNRLAKPKTV